MNYVSYCRVSTKAQAESRYGLDDQRKKIRDFLQPDDNLLNEFTEIASGGKDDRPILNEALRIAKLKNATLIVSKLDRLSRSTPFINKLQNTNVKFLICNMPHAETFTIHVLAGVAELELKQIRERIKAALAQAKLRGVKLGNPENLRTTQADRMKGIQTMKRKADEFAMEMISSILEIKKEGIESYSGIARKLTERNVRTARGGKWTGTTVKNVMKRYDLKKNSSKPPSEWLVQPINKQTRTMLIKAGMAQAKSKGVEPGNPQNLINTPANRQKATRAIKAKADDFVIYMIPIINNVRQAGQHSYAGIARELNLRGLKSSRGREWTRKAVRNLLKRYDNIISSSSNPNLIISSNTTQSKILPSNHILPPPPISNTLSHPNVSQILPEANISPPPSLVLDYISPDNSSPILPAFDISPPPPLISNYPSSPNALQILPEASISPPPPIIDYHSPDNSSLILPTFDISLPLPLISDQLSNSSQILPNFNISPPPLIDSITSSNIKLSLLPNYNLPPIFSD